MDKNSAIEGAVVKGSKPIKVKDETTGKEKELQTVDVKRSFELAWNAHILGMGIILLALGLLAANPVRARIGAIAVVAVMGSQFLAAGASAAYGYGGFNGLDIVALAIMIVPLITLIACLTKLNAR